MPFRALVALPFVLLTAEVITAFTITPKLNARLIVTLTLSLIHDDRFGMDACSVAPYYAPVARINRIAPIYPEPALVF
jgi:hypothetical protein